MTTKLECPECGSPADCPTPNFYVCDDRTFKTMSCKNARNPRKFVDGDEVSAPVVDGEPQWKFSNTSGRVYHNSKSLADLVKNYPGPIFKDNGDLSSAWQVKDQQKSWTNVFLSKYVGRRYDHESRQMLRNDLAVLRDTFASLGFMFEFSIDASFDPISTWKDAVEEWQADVANLPKPDFQWDFGDVAASEPILTAQLRATEQWNKHTHYTGPGPTAPPLMAKRNCTDPDCCCRGKGEE